MIEYALGAATVVLLVLGWHYRAKIVEFVKARLAKKAE